MGFANRNLMNSEFFKICGILHIFVSLVMIVLQCIIRTRMILMNKWREIFHNFKIKFKAVAKSDDLKDQVIMAILEKNTIDVKVSEYLTVIKKQSELEMGDEGLVNIPWLKYMAYNAIFILSDSGFNYFIFYCTCSFFALLGNIPILYSFFLFEIIVNFFFIVSRGSIL